MSQMNPKEVFHNTASSVQLPYIAGHTFKTVMFCECSVNNEPVKLYKRK